MPEVYTIRRTRKSAAELLYSTGRFATTLFTDKKWERELVEMAPIGGTAEVMFVEVKKEATHEDDVDGTDPERQDSDGDSVEGAEEE